jgi:hypothetical protein
MRRVLLVLVTAITVFVPSAVARRGLPKVLTQETPVFQVRPATISYTGDGTGIVGGLDGSSVQHLGHLNWIAYNSRDGLAVGLVWLDNCTPDCAHGRFSAHRVHVRVSQVSNGHFRLLTLSYRDQGHSYLDHRVAHYYHGGGEAFWAYAICDAQYTPRCP